MPLRFTYKFTDKNLATFGDKSQLNPGEGHPYRGSTTTWPPLPIIEAPKGREGPSLNQPLSRGWSKGLRRLHRLTSLRDRQAGPKTQTNHAQGVRKRPPWPLSWVCVQTNREKSSVTKHCFLSAGRRGAIRAEPTSLTQPKRLLNRCMGGRRRKAATEILSQLDRCLQIPTQ